MRRAGKDREPGGNNFGNLLGLNLVSVLPFGLPIIKGVVTKDTAPNPEQVRNAWIYEFVRFPIAAAIALLVFQDLSHGFVPAYLITGELGLLRVLAFD